MSASPSATDRWRKRLRLLRQCVLLGWVDRLVMLWPTRRRRGLLVVRLDAIGDFVLWQAQAEQLRQAFPGQRLVLAANALWAPLAQQLPHWDAVMAVDVPRLERDLGYRLGLFWRLRHQGFDTALQPTHSRQMFSGDAMVHASGARQRLGCSDRDNRMSPRLKRIADGWYTWLVDTGTADAHELLHHRQLMAALGLPALMQPQPAQLPTVADLPERLRLDGPYVIVVPGAGWRGRQWPAAAFIQLLQRFAALNPGWQPVLCGSQADHALCAAIAAGCAQPVVNLAGRTSLTQLCELVRRAQLLVGNETAAVHIAAAVGTPSVCVLGGGHMGRFLPYPAHTSTAPPQAVHVTMDCFGCDWACHRPHAAGQAVPCVAAVDVEAVLQAMVGALGATPASARTIRRPRHEAA